MSILTTPFARKVLPRFGAWFYRALEQEEPHYLVPVERKGAHLLDAVLAYLSLHQSSPVRASVLYRRAFSYLAPDSLDGAKVLLLDDATHTGKTLHDYSRAVKGCGNAHVRMLACIGVALPTDDPARKLRADISCFVEPPEDKYHEYLWQMSELVLARGLTPELDHHQFRLSASGSLLRLWPRMLSALADYGVLDVHGPLEIGTGTHGATLHWPTFLPRDMLPDQGVVRKDGVVKLRLFADFASDAVTAIPMVFPEVLVPSLSEARESLLHSIDSWTGSTDPILRLVLDSACMMSPEVLFQAASLHCEIVLMQYLCQILREALGDGTAITVASDRASLLRLYGPHLAPALADRLDTQLAEPKQAERPALPRARQKHETEPANTDEINSEVNGATDQLLLFLKREYQKRNADRPRHQWETVGLGFADLRNLPPFRDHQEGDLLLSRSIDLGCATAGLVPYTIGEATSEGEFVVLRKYRTAENVRTTPEEIEDYRFYQKEVSAEVVGAVSSFLSRRSTRWKNRSTPPFVLDKVIAILNGAAPDAAERRVLVVVPKEHGPEAAFAITPLVGSPSYRMVRAVTSESYSISSDGGIAPTPTFLKRYNERSLRISQRDELLTLEAYLQALVPVLDSSDNVATLLTCWSISANGRLGLDYVMADVELALDALSEPVEVLAGRRKLVQQRLVRSCDRSIHYLGIAVKEKLEPLTRDWAAPAVEHWTDPVAVEANLLKSLAAPHEHSLFFSVASAFVHSVRYVTETVRLASDLEVGDENQRNLFADGSSQDTAKVRSEVTERLDKVWERLRALRDEGSHRSLAGIEEVDQNANLASHYKRTLETLRRYASAFAWSYSRLINWRGEGLPNSSPRNRTILFADMTGSTPASLGLPHEENVRWRNNGLDLLAQWGQAFGGRESAHIRKGDDICLEFPDPESAILCGAIVQEHLAALRSTGLPENTYRFLMAVDSSWISSADGGNLIGVGIDRAAKTAKAEIPDEPEETMPARIVITPEVVRDCSDRLRPFLSESSHMLKFGEGERGEFRPWRVNRRGLIQSYVDRLREL